MKTIKVCGRRSRVFYVAGTCLFAGFALCGCTVAEKLPYRQVIYKATYNFLRTAECQNTAEQQHAYQQCVKSYTHDFEAYRKLREQFVKRNALKDKPL